MNASFPQPKDGAQIGREALGGTTDEAAEASRESRDPSASDGLRPTPPPTSSPSSSPASRPVRARLRNHAGDRGRASVDCGLEPPLDSTGEFTAIARRGVSWRWLAGGILTGFTGAALIGAAIYVAVEGSTAPPAPPERLSARAAGPEASPRRVAARGDRLVRTAFTVTASYTFRAPKAHRDGEREILRVQNFTRLATGLSLTTGVHASNVPAFNPMRYFGSDAEEALAIAAAASAPDLASADVTFVRRPLADGGIGRAAPALSDADALAQVHEERRLLAAAGQRRGIPLPTQTLLTRTLARSADIPGMTAHASVRADSFDSIEVRVIPENVSNLMKRDPAEIEAAGEEIGLALGRDQTLAELLAEQGAGTADIAGVIAALGGEEAVAALPPGQSLRLLTEPPPRPGDPRTILRVVLYGANGIEAIAAASDQGTIVAVAPPVDHEGAGATAVAEVEPEGQGGARLYESLFETGLKNGLSQEAIEDLVRVFVYDLDFQRRVQPGDAIDLFYTYYDDDAPIEVLSAALTVGGETRRVYRFVDPDDGSVDFFDEDGRSLKKFLMRKPLAEGRMTSGFGMRRHPILRYARMHTGVDWANRIGTPIFAAGNGTVTRAEWAGGYGRRIEIQHANGYVTTYSHLSRFAPGIEAGARVTQGQVIGALGNSGLSTGPHLHYEVLVNGRFVDPLKIRVPRSRELDGRELASFMRQRDQIDQLMDRAGGPARLAQTLVD